MDLKQINETISSISYKNYSIQWIEETLNIEIRIVTLAKDAYSKLEYNDRPFVCVCSYNRTQLGYDRLTRDSLIKLVYETIRQLELHELDEFFLVNGERLFDPHKEKEYFPKLELSQMESVNVETDS